MIPSSFADWAAEYAHYDVPSMFAEAELLPEVAQVTRLCAMFTRLVDLACCERGVSLVHRGEAAQLADATLRNLRDIANATPGLSGNLEPAIAATRARAATAPNAAWGALINWDGTRA